MQLSCQILTATPPPGIHALTHVAVVHEGVTLPGSSYCCGMTARNDRAVVQGGQSSAELASLVELLPGCRLLIDTDYRIVATNACYRTHCGAGSACSVIGRHCYEVSHGYDAPCDQNGEACPVTAARSSGEIERCVHVHHSSGGPEHVAVEIFPLRDDHGDVSLFMEHLEPMAGVGRPSHYVGSAPAFLRTLEFVKRVAATETSVLLLGETGTGKEVLARAVHDMSARAAGPFVVVDCAGLAETLFESELFGHEKGAFTGAVVRKPGLVEAAAGGTLFIDEVGDIPLSLQVKLLRLLETGLYRRVGGTEMQTANCRLVAATHRDLEEMVRHGQFRPDLYYRISAFPVAVPALRARSADVGLLARSILARLQNGHALNITPEALRVLSCYAFPGNVRELRNILERACLLADGSWIDVCHLPESVRGTPAALAPLDRAAAALDSRVSPLQEAEQSALRQALRSHVGSRRELAATLGLSERTLYRKLRALAEPRCG